MNSSAREFYDVGWGKTLSSGGEDSGDLECDIVLIRKTGLLEKHHAILEFGCGIGKLCNWLKENGYGSTIGIDISAQAVGYGLKRYPGLNLLCTDEESFRAPAASFDMCMSFDFIEHLHNVQGHLRRAYELLKPGGAYIIQTPNKLANALYSTISLRGFAWQEYHPSLQTRESLEKNFIDAGFSRVQFYKISPVSAYKLAQLHWSARWLFANLPWEKMPTFLQVGIYAAAWK